ncbi:MAG: tRNA (guanine(37)-N(1))-methyltransferase, partial [uncultured Solirubrobacteraceae bacterium]
ADRRLHALSRVVRLVPLPAARDQRDRPRPQPAVRRLPGHHAAEGGAGRRHAVRRRCRHGAARRRGGGCPARPLRRRSGRREGSPARDRDGAGRPPARRRAGGGAGGRARADAAVWPLRGLRRADRRALLHGEGLDRPVRGGRGRATRHGRLRRGPAAAAGHARPRRVGRRGVLQHRTRRRPRVPALHAARRLAGMDGPGRAVVRSPRQHQKLAGRSEPAPGRGREPRRPRSSATI